MLHSLPKFDHQKHLADFEQDGFVIVKNAVKTSDLVEIQNNIDTMQFKDGDDWHPSYRYKNVFTEMCSG